MCYNNGVIIMNGFRGLIFFYSNMLSEFKMIGSGLATIALSGVGVGIGYIFGSLSDAVSRNPSITRALFNYAILGFALTEAIALFTIMIVFLILY
jgi:F-type H+-transporting ATPase subunit c